MTKQSTSGGQEINKTVKNRELKDHINKEAAVKLETDVDGVEKEVGWDVKEAEVHSDTKLEDDKGEGNAVVIRTFDFSANPEAFQKHTPSKQELFNTHIKQIEVLLFTDGLRIMTDVIPQVKISKNKKFYRIVVGAEPARGQRLWETPQTLTQLVNDSGTNTN